MILVQRRAYFPFGTFGYISWPGQKTPPRFNLEVPNHGVHKPNATPPIFTCIPCGDYKLELHNTEKHPNTRALVNHSLKVYHEPEEGMPEDAWTAVLLHPANLASQLEACLAQGRLLTFLGSPPVLGIGDSGTAYSELMAYIEASGDDDLRIEDATGEPWPTT